MKQKKALMTASVASMIDLFNMDNIHILQELGYEVHVAANFEFGSITSKERVSRFRNELEAAGIRTFHIEIPRNITDMKGICSSYQKMKKLCEQERYDLIHTQSPIGGVVARLAAKKMRKHGTKVIYVAHGFHFYAGAPKKNWVMFYPVEKMLSRYTDVLITINQEDYQRAEKFYAKEVYYVPGIGIDIHKYETSEADRQSVRNTFGFTEDDFVIMSVGQLSKRKNQETVIRAMAEIPDEKVKYLIVGLGEKEDSDRQLITQLDLKTRVVLAGYREDIKELLHAADAFVFPSLQEGLPVALMEAMAAGLPSVSSRIRGNVDLISDGIEGKLVEPMDIRGYAQAVMELERQPSVREKLIANSKRKIQQFSIEHVHEKMKQIYLTIGKN